MVDVSPSLSYLQTELLVLGTTASPFLLLLSQDPAFLALNWGVGREEELYANK